MTNGPGLAAHRVVQVPRRLVGVSCAKQLRITPIATQTNANTTAAWATYAARADMEAPLVMPQDAPELTRKECLVTGPSSTWSMRLR